MNYDFSDVTSENEAERLGRLYPIKIEEHNPKWWTYVNIMDTKERKS